MKSESGGISPLDGLKIARYRYHKMGAIIGVAAFLLAGAMSIPFFFESPSMWYKFGFAKVLLRTGKIIGMLAVTLLFLQLILASRLKRLDQVFSLPGMIHAHRINAIIILPLAFFHPILVLTSDSKLTIPLEMRYWPEWMGVGLFVLILIQFSLSQWRIALRLKYHLWLIFHRCLGTCILALVITHILFVSETFSEPGFPRSLILISAAVLFLFWLRNRLGQMRIWQRSFLVTRVASEGLKNTCLELRPLTDQPFQYYPGQFVFISVQSEHISHEPHPFTLSSTPTRGQNLQVTVRDSGDWTQNVSQITKGDRVYLQGPFGMFSHMLTEPGRDVVMIAGGIGITPMLSMLRYMVDRQDSRAITLIWSNRTRADVVYSEEIYSFTTKLTDFRVVLMFTRESEKGLSTGRLDREKLETILQGSRPKSSVFVCGPPKMMKQVEKDLKVLGFASHLIHMERFGW